MFDQFKPSHMRQLLGVCFSPSARKRDTAGGIQQPYFYESSQAIVFPPVTDDAEYGMLETIEDTLRLAADVLPENRNKIMLFPVGQSQYILSRFPSIIAQWLPIRRLHWVTLHYDPATKIATLIDSRSSWVSILYDTTAIKVLLTHGLDVLGFEVNAFEFEYQGIQQDSIRCGDWTAINIEALANGASIKSLLKTLSANDLPPIIEHNRALHGGVNSGVYQSAVSRPNSPESLSASDSLMPGDKANFSETTEQTWINTAIKLFLDFFSNPSIARESVQEPATAQCLLTYPEHTSISVSMTAGMGAMSELTGSALGYVDISYFEARRPAACPRDPEILLNAKAYCTETDRDGSRGQAAGRRDLNCQQPLLSHGFFTKEDKDNKALTNDTTSNNSLGSPGGRG